MSEVVGRGGDSRCARWLAVVSIAASFAPAQGWVALTPVAPPAPCVRVLEADGGELVLADQRVSRRRGATTTELEPTVGEPVGAHTMCRSPGGATFVAAANGLFVTHPEVATLDRVDFAEGGPDGPIVGLVADRIDRLWVASPTRLFVVHTGLWFHHEHGAADGLPPGPFTGLSLAADGTLQLHHAEGVHGYRPDPAPPQLSHAAVRVAAPGGTVQLDCRGSADAVGFRCRERSHHLLRDAARPVDLRHPGRHELLVYALDRDLDLSAPRELGVDVPFSTGLGVRHVVLVSVALALVLGGWRIAVARRRRRPWWRAGLDAVLVAVVTLQLGMAMTSIGRTWPFIGFTMYGEVYQRSSVLFTPALVARGRGGDHFAHDGMLAFATDGVWRHLTSLWFADPGAQRAFVNGLGAEVETLELRIRRCRLTRSGPREVAPWVLARLARGEPR